jgi:hypothetical protein
MNSIASAAAAFEKKNIYRVFQLGRFLTLLKQRTNTLVRPALWEDPWEEWWSSLVRKRLGATLPADVFGQCWTTSKESDAMWRVYAPQQDGIKVRTTVGALRESISDANMRYRATVSRVLYLSDTKLIGWGTGMIGHLEKKPSRGDLKDVRRALARAGLDSLIMGGSSREQRKFFAIYEADEFLRAVNAIGQYKVKRLAFRWEHEVRLLAWSPERLGLDTLPYPFDPAKNIHEVVFDPRMAEATCALVREHLERLGLKCRSYRSRLYSLDV